MYCGPDTFERLAPLIVAEAPLPEGVSLADIHCIVVLRRQEAQPVERGWRGPLVLVGCAVICFLFISVFTAGIVQIMQLFNR